MNVDKEKHVKHFQLAKECIRIAEEMLETATTSLQNAENEEIDPYLVEQLQQQQNLIVKENQLIQACERLDLQ